eukprot:gb/GECH01013835.1/.p1 GENE.gb/GECH01013835.1/~~gb/GECH01013835.1/.p1  ORF type:complete len:285 (+),score=55.25 gb/GECH01013835.1/:1-855(+)
MLQGAFPGNPYLLPRRQKFYLLILATIWCLPKYYNSEFYKHKAWQSREQFDQFFFKLRERMERPVISKKTEETLLRIGQSAFYTNHTVDPFPEMIDNFDFRPQMVQAVDKLYRKSMDQRQWVKPLLGADYWEDPEVRQEMQRRREQLRTSPGRGVFKKRPEEVLGFPKPEPPKAEPNLDYRPWNERMEMARRDEKATPLELKDFERLMALEDQLALDEDNGMWPSGYPIDLDEGRNIATKEQAGPIMDVLPSQTWFGNMSDEQLEEFQDFYPFERSDFDGYDQS